MAVEAARHVETLSITRSSELVVPAARRFANVSEVNILCLVKPQTYEDGAAHLQDEGDSLLFAATRIVPFLGSIPNLEKVYIGRLFGESSDIDPSEMVWDPVEFDIYDFDRMHINSTAQIFTTLMENLCGGFESRVLKQNLRLRGVLESNQLICAASGDEEHPDRPCHCCRRILSCFPFRTLFPSISLWVFCLSTIERIRHVMDRDGAGAALRTNAGAKMLLECLGNALPQMIWLSRRNEVDKAFEEKMLGQGAERHHPGKLGMTWAESTDSHIESLTEILDMVQGSSLLHDAIKDIPRSSIQSVYAFNKNGYGKKHIFARNIFDMLLAAGLNLDANDYIIVDPEKEPALKRWL